jgi:Histidine kinase-, DNA gyrase B-, and HSP90-like ATPase
VGAREGDRLTDPKDRYAHISDAECDLAEPHAAPMSESLRAFGYELPSAIADLIDNSIFAKARNVWVDFEWDGASSTITVTDDGAGMSESELVDAMRPGSRNPLESRDPKDLGRYGLGLKTASFSQCRRLVVRSKTSESVATRCWDLDFVAEKDRWLLLRDAGTASEPRFARLAALPRSTTVLWEKMDRLVRDRNVNDDGHKRLFHARIEAVERHLAMVFHRFMEEPPHLKIFVNGNPIAAWDPFLKAEKATQQIADERISVFQKQVSVIPFVLPHVSKLTAEVHGHAAGTNGWNLHQGFYVYRNRRLLVPGDWLGLGFAKEEHFKLARIQLDIPNSMDHEWEIDVTKSKARPPDTLRKELRYIAEITRRRASEVYRHRGKVIARKSAQEYLFVWQQITRRGKYFYRINREHPLVASALDAEHDRLEPLLRMIEETVPVPLLAITNSEQPDKHAAPFEGAPPREILPLLRLVYQAMRDSNVPHTTAVERLRIMEPFDRFPELIETFDEQFCTSGS